MNQIFLKPDRASLVTCKPDPAHEKMVRDALAYLVFKAPFFSHLFYNEMSLRYVPADSPIPYAATDSYSIFLNMPRMIEAGMGVIKQLAFVLAHEVSHRVFDDLIMMAKFKEIGEVPRWGGGKPLPYQHERMNVAQDLRINPMLIKAGIGEMPKIGLLDKGMSAEGLESAVEIYSKLPQSRSGGVGGQSGQSGQSGHGGFDIHLDAPANADSPAEQSRRKQAIVAAAEAARAAGKGDLPGALGILLGDILEPKVSWNEFLRALMFRAAGDPAYDWRYLDKRLLVRPDPMYFARQAHQGCGEVVIAIDTSGSVYGKTDEFLAEAGGILRDLNPSRLIVIWCDAAVGMVQDLEDIDDVSDVKADFEAQGGATGGGGTDFNPVFDMVTEMGLQPDMLVYLTDTYGSFPAHEPDYPVIWGSIVKSPHVPWGQVVEIDV